MVLNKFYCMSYCCPLVICSNMSWTIRSAHICLKCIVECSARMQSWARCIQLNCRRCRSSTSKSWTCRSRARCWSPARICTRGKTWTDCIEKKLYYELYADCYINKISCKFYLYMGPWTRFICICISFWFLEIDGTKNWISDLNSVAAQ